MENLIKIQKTDSGIQVVSAIELHEFLEVKAKFIDWIKRMIEYGFEKEVDYSLLKVGKQDSHGGQNKIEYALTVDCAKEISMIQRTDKGKQARKYFIAVEKELMSKLLPMTQDELVLTATRSLEATIKLQKESIQKQLPKVRYFDNVLSSRNGMPITFSLNFFSIYFMSL